LEPSEILHAAREAEQNGAGHFCLVTSGKRISEAEFEAILDTLKEIKKTTGLKLDCSLGHLPREYFIELHRIGVSRYNHNLEAAKSFFPTICSTHTYQDRWDTVRAIQEAGLETCCGGIIGMGETREQRLELAFALKELGVECATINILNPRPGTPLDHTPPLPPWEIIKTIAIFRLILPNSIIKLAGGRERNLRDLQSLGILAGVNGLIIGGYLTTSGRSIADDLQMIKDLDLET
jgi:biotin synthase